MIRRILLATAIVACQIAVREAVFRSGGLRRVFMPVPRRHCYGFDPSDPAAKAFFEERIARLQRAKPSN